MKTVATVEARMTSSRLPGKVLMPAAGRPLLALLIDRLKQVPSIDEIVLATTTNATDDVLVEFARNAGIGCFRGSEDNVMSRVIGAADSAKAEIVVEITGDCPLIDPRIIEHVIRMFHANPCDYLSNVGERETYPGGMDTQVFKLETLKRSFAMTTHRLDLEHVTRHIRMHPELFSQIVLVAPPELHWPELALTLDEPKDYELIRRIVEAFGPKRTDFSCAEIIHLLRAEHPEWPSINHDVARKGMHA